ncbi:hypothetical protein [Rhodoplanes roseus]|uniref:hypothetical protein n=1 Tax=Rhodoplanes roseus TaxID=29409 RepID=UPI0011B77849|nr:hypothetical protein [Rhodoplanes roseus]
MMIFDFISQAEIEDLPDHDPPAAFIEFVRIAKARLRERTSEISSDDPGGWDELQEARQGFMNVVVAAAKNYSIEPIASLSVPRIKDFDADAHRQFGSDLDHYLTQILLDNNSRVKKDSVLISPDTKSAIRTYIFHLRELIEKAEGVDEIRRNALLRKLDEFESELEKRRLSLMAVTVLAITLVSAPGGFGATADLANKLITNILRSVGEAKQAEDEMRRLPSAVSPMAITGPRKEALRSSEAASHRPADLDDDIPF